AQVLTGFQTVARPSTTAMLWHTYHHAFRSKLHWVPWRLRDCEDMRRLLGAADLDWAVVGRWIGLRSIAELTNLSEPLLAMWPKSAFPRATLERFSYSIWPNFNWLRIPSRWWLAMRHGIEGE